MNTESDISSEQSPWRWTKSNFQRNFISLLARPSQMKTWIKTESLSYSWPFDFRPLMLFCCGDPLHHQVLLRNRNAFFLFLRRFFSFSFHKNLFVWHRWKTDKKKTCVAVSNTREKTIFTSTSWWWRPSCVEPCLLHMKLSQAMNTWKGKPSHWNFHELFKFIFFHEWTFRST